MGRRLVYATFLSIMILSGCSQRGIVDSEKTNEILYDVVFRGSHAGQYLKKDHGGNNFSYTYTYTDRGRGPRYIEKIELNENNYIIGQSISGVNYRKMAIEESFSSKGNTASWKNTKEDKTAPFDGNELYFRYDGSPAVYEILAQIFLRSNNQKVNLFPEGEAELVEQIPHTLSNGVKVTVLVMKGLGLNLSYIWMQGGEMVASLAGNLHIARTDLSSLRLEMKAFQDDLEDKHLVNVAKQLTHKIDLALISNVNVFTPEGTLLRNQDVLIEGSAIKSINPTSQNRPSGSLVIDGSNKTLMPGMFDLHTHNTKFRGILHLAGGITSVKDLANNKKLNDLGAQFNSNEILGPRIVTYCGIIDGPGPFANQRNVVQNLEEALAEVQEYKDLGYQQIKLYSSILPEWVEPLAKKAHNLGMRVSGHIPAYMTATQAINSGYNEIQHINMLFLNFLPDTIDTRTPLRHTMPAEHGADLNLNSKPYQDFVDLLKSKDILVDLTMAVFENMYVSQRGEASPTFSKIIHRLPLIEQRKHLGGGLSKEGAQIVRYQQSFEKMLNVIYDLFERGVAIVPGTDGLPGFLYHRELELYTRAGIPVKEVLKLATIKSAEISGVDDQYGSVEAGKNADLILVDGNPLEDISDIRRIEWTMKGGNLYYAHELYKTVGIQHFE